MSVDISMHLVVTLVRTLVKEYELQQQVVTIGRDPQQDVVIDNPSVSRGALRDLLRPGCVLGARSGYR